MRAGKRRGRYGAVLRLLAEHDRDADGGRVAGRFGDELPAPGGDCVRAEDGSVCADGGQTEK